MEVRSPSVFVQNFLWILSSVRVKVKGSPPLLSSLTSSTIHSPLWPLCFNHTGLLVLAQIGHLCSCLSFTQNPPPLVSPKVSPLSLLARGQLLNGACFITLFNTATPSPAVLIPLAAFFFFFFPVVLFTSLTYYTVDFFMLSGQCLSPWTTKSAPQGQWFGLFCLMM